MEVVYLLIGLVMTACLWLSMGEGAAAGVDLAVPEATVQIVTMSWTNSPVDFELQTTVDLGRSVPRTPLTVRLHPAPRRAAGVLLCLLFVCSFAMVMLN